MFQIETSFAIALCMAEKKENPNAFKNWINPKVALKIQKAVAGIYPDLNSKTFQFEVQGLEKLELKARVQLIREALFKTLPADFPKACKILLQSVDKADIRGFELWPYTEFIQTHGLSHFEESLEALEFLTERFTAEFAIRPFIAHAPEKTYKALLKLSTSSNHHVRRWCSEGSRPLLPWGQKLTIAVKDPSQGLNILEKLKYDEELYVRKSVANHLNDISKHHPDLVVKTLKGWNQKAPAKHQEKIQWITRHALRTLIKKGHAPTLKLLGVDSKPAIKFQSLKLNKKTFAENETLLMSFDIQSLKKQKLIIDYVIHYQKANGSLSAKVFKLKVLEVGKNETIRIEKKHVLRKVTTRKHYPGPHKLGIQINGQSLGILNWDLKA